MCSDDLYGQILVGNIRAYLLSRSQRGKDGHRGSKGDKACFCQAGRNPKHILFGNPDVIKAVGKHVSEVFNGGRFFKIRCNADDPVILLGQCGERSPVDFPGGHC